MTAGAGVRFERIEIRYGRHAAAFELSPEAAAANGGSRKPFVILGPNGAGKSTLVEALLRTLFGFRRLSPTERETHDLRRPWRGGGYRGRVRMRTAEGTCTFERDFDTDHVRVVRAGRESPVFEEEANPARDGSESMSRYRALLERTLGLTELDAYLRTACVFQGELIGTDLSVGLLRVAAGGHADIETARARLVEEYRRLTVQPIADDVSRRRKPGELERAVGEAEELEARLAEARATESRRLPLVRSRDELRARLGTLETEIERLSDAFETLSEAERLDLECEASRGRIRTLEGAARELDEALARLELLADRAETDRAARYPADFETRARILEEELWPSVAEIDRELVALRTARPGRASPIRHPGALAGLGVVTVAGAVLGLTGHGMGYALAAAGLVGMAEWWRTVRAERLRAADRGRRLAELERKAAEKRARIEGYRKGVPDGHALARENLPAHRREFEREKNDGRLRAEAEARLRQTMDAALGALASVERPADDVSRADRERTGDDARGSGATGDVRLRARDLLKRLEGRAALERDDVMAPLRFRLGELGRSRFELPPDVDPTLEAVRRARRGRLETSEAVRAELAGVERDLALEARQGESALSIARELEAARVRSRALSARAAAYRRAHALITRAYEEFRRTDEERLVAAISWHLIELSGGDLGPLEVEEGLESAAVRVGERALPLASPPLSYGQLHAALLAVRLGAADFLAGLGVRIPLLIDDPFVHLDERSAADLWRVLERVARERQVIIATQDRLILAHLGVAADLELAGPRVAAPPREAETAGVDARGAERVPREAGSPAGAARDARRTDEEGGTGTDEDGGARRDRRAPAADERSEASDASEPLDLWSQADA